MNPQVPIENAADPMHFAFVHGSDRPARSDVFELKDEYLRSVLKVHFGGGKGSTWLTPDGHTWGTIEAEQWGLGIGVARLNIGPVQEAQSFAGSPIDDIRATAGPTTAPTAVP